MSRWLQFDRQLREVDEDIEKLERLLAAPSISEERRTQVRRQMADMRRRQAQITREVFSRLNAWDNVLLARHVDRPAVVSRLQALTLHGPVFQIVVVDGEAVLPPGQVLQLPGALGDGIGDAPLLGLRPGFGGGGIDEADDRAL